MSKLADLISRAIFQIRNRIFQKSNMICNKKLIIGDNCVFNGSPLIRTIPNTQISIGSNCILDSNPKGYHAGMAFPVTLTTDYPSASISIGKNCRLHGCCLHAWHNIKIGNYCLIASGVQIIDSNGHNTEFINARNRTFLKDEPKPIVIEDYCWLSLNVIILKGVILGEGCLVGANSVVSEGIYPPFSLLVGNPAKIIHSVDSRDVLPQMYRND